jgi:hypothetical protein
MADGGWQKADGRRQMVAVVAQFAFFNLQFSIFLLRFAFCLLHFALCIPPNRPPGAYRAAS